MRMWVFILLLDDFICTINPMFKLYTNYVVHFRNLHKWDSVHWIICGRWCGWCMFDGLHEANLLRSLFPYFLDLCLVKCKNQIWCATCFNILLTFLNTQGSQKRVENSVTCITSYFTLKKPCANHQSQKILEFRVLSYANHTIYSYYVSFFWSVVLT
jgi:hypothetical protein